MKQIFGSTRSMVVTLALVAASCGGSRGNGRTTGGRGGNGGAPVAATDPPAHAAAVAALRAEIASDRPADAAAFQSRWSTSYLTALPYDPAQAEGMDKLAASQLGVSDPERQALARNGFVISRREVFPTFFYGYKAIYADHLPLFVSVDSVMHAVHRSYDSVLMQIETLFLTPTLKSLLAAMHANLASGGGGDLPGEVRADVDLYLTVARRLLGEPASAAAPVAGAQETEVKDW